ncbi:MAG: type II toxin-antitoxin system VapC family toxin [Acidimicrobiia bacterium]
MIAYFDTSAVVPLLVAEQGSSAAHAAWNAATRVASVRLVYPESRAALAQAHRSRRITTRQLRRAVDVLELICAQLDVVEVDDDLAHHAGELAEAHGLRGYDAVHLAAADRMRDAELVMVAGDRALLDATQRLGIDTAAVG